MGSDKKKNKVEIKTKLKTIDSASLGLSNRTKVAVDNKNNHYIIKNIKSRIIMKDGKKINETAKTIRKTINTKIYLATTAPVCSKTKAYLKNKKIKTVSKYITL